MPKKKPSRIVGDSGDDYQEIISILSKMNSSEIEAYLNQEKKVKLKKDLLGLAKEMSLNISGYQTVLTIKHSIIKHFPSKDGLYHSK